MSDKKYNGWTNWETWDANLILMSDPNIYESVLDIVYTNAADIAPYELSIYWKELVKSRKVDEIDVTKVNWKEIMESIEEDLTL